ncbi:MAG TPA: hypothetical protein VLA52_10775 [Thermohalobaculum sp.]|nr:hypothetical protein [Thermohalobaculum sp.]
MGTVPLRSDADSERASRLFGKSTDDRFRGDLGSAYRHAKAAADNGLASAAYAVSRMHSDGSAPKDDERERIYLDKAARMGHLLARRDLIARALSRENAVWVFAGLSLRYLIVNARIRFLRAVAPEDDRLRS